MHAGGEAHSDPLASLLVNKYQFDIRRAPVTVGGLTDAAHRVFAVDGRTARRARVWLLVLTWAVFRAHVSVHLSARRLLRRAVLVSN